MFEHKGKMGFHIVQHFTHLYLTEENVAAFVVEWDSKYRKEVIQESLELPLSME